MLNKHLPKNVNAGASSYVLFSQTDLYQSPITLSELSIMLLILSYCNVVCSIHLSLLQLSLWKKETRLYLNCSGLLQKLESLIIFKYLLVT